MCFKKLKKLFCHLHGMPDETNILSMECTDVCKCRGLCGKIIYDSVSSDNNDVEEDNENDNADDNA